jgi:hypothetical protein
MCMVVAARKVCEQCCVVACRGRGACVLWGVLQSVVTLHATHSFSCICLCNQACGTVVCSTTCEVGHPPRARCKACKIGVESVWYGAEPWHVQSASATLGLPRACCPIGQFACTWTEGSARTEKEKELGHVTSAGAEGLPGCWWSPSLAWISILGVKGMTASHIPIHATAHRPITRHFSHRTKKGCGTDEEEGKVSH